MNPPVIKTTTIQISKTTMSPLSKTFLAAKGICKWCEKVDIYGLYCSKIRFDGNVALTLSHFQTTSMTISKDALEAFYATATKQFKRSNDLAFTGLF
jgi:hypothetical protein